MRPRDLQLSILDPQKPRQRVRGELVADPFPELLHRSEFLGTAEVGDGGVEADDGGAAAAVGEVWELDAEDVGFFDGAGKGVVSARPRDTFLAVENPRVKSHHRSNLCRRHVLL
jgi:hypothetical protein